jgi:hypothetical protein
LTTWVTTSFSMELVQSEHPDSWPRIEHGTYLKRSANTGIAMFVLINSTFVDYLTSLYQLQISCSVEWDNIVTMHVKWFVKMGSWPIFLGTIPVFEWRDWGRYRNPSGQPNNNPIFKMDTSSGVCKPHYHYGNLLFTEFCRWILKIPALYSGRPGLYFWPEIWLSWLRILCGFHQSFQANVWILF